MKASADDAAQFREECLRWQAEFGLTDWSLDIKSAPTTDDTEAKADYDCDTRLVQLTYYVGTNDVAHPLDNALHEMLHVLFADMLLAAVQAKSESDATLGREEHKVIERLARVLGKRKGPK